LNPYINAYIEEHMPIHPRLAHQSQQFTYS